MNNIRTIKLDRIWTLGTGIKCLIDEKQYLYLGRGINRLGEFVNTETLDTVYEDDFEVDEIVVYPIPDIDGLVEAKTRGLMQLIAEGWTDSRDFLNASNRLEELRMYKKLQRIVNGNIYETR